MEKLENFKTKGKLTHNNKYDYSKVVFVSTKTKVDIICPIHGEFSQTPEKHILGKQGCPNCSKTKKLTTNDFIIKSNLIHNNKYDYSKVNYLNANSNVKIICPMHGEFEQIAKIHMVGANCPICFGKNKSKDDMIDMLKTVHGNKYDYSKINYINQKLPLIIICPTHGEFKQTFNTHKKGHGCPKCVGRYKTTDEFIIESNLKHNNKYDYSLVDYKNNKSKIKIICPIHGVFEQVSSNHLFGSGCPKCKFLTLQNLNTKTTDEFTLMANIKHNNKYDYSETKYIGAKDYLNIKCKKHGEFKQEASSHLLGSGCPKCSFKFNKIELQIKDFLSLNNVSFIENSRNIISPLELDIYVPSHNIAIEFNGLYWHNELYKPSNYHLNKTELCEKQGIKLIHIFEDEWLFKQEIVKSRLKNLFGLTKNKIFGRKTEIKEVSSKESKAFLDNNHIQGNVNSSIRIGLYYNNELVSLMCFGKPRLGIGTKYDGYELTRFCNKLDTNVIGGADKLLKYFIKTYQPKEIISYADRRWSQGDLYRKLGFTEIRINKPNYHYVISDKRKHRFGFRKEILKKQGFDTKNKTEHEIMKERGIYRIYDCGTITYKIKPII